MKFKRFSGRHTPLQWPRPGFESQVCIILNIIFQYVFSCRHNMRAHHTSSNWTIHASKIVRSMAKIQSVSYLRSTASHMIRKVSEFKAWWAKITRPKPPIWGNTPLWFDKFYFFFLISFNYYFNCCVYLNYCLFNF